MKRKGEKQQEEDECTTSTSSTCNHGKKWVRGPMIGKGNSGRVYKATLREPISKYSCFPPVMAVKSAEVSVSGSIQKESVVLSYFRGCPNVIQCFGEDITEDEKGRMIYNLLLEHASGGTLSDVIKKSNGSGLPESIIKRYTKAIVSGIQDVHKLGYVHCDLKPENILIFHDSGREVVKISDFGSAKKVKQKNKKKRKLDPYLRGTAMYMAPEAWTAGVQECPSDIWALGCIVLEMLTGKPVWDKEPDDKIGYGCQLPRIPTGISKEAKQFLKGCFARRVMFRFTAEMLMCHEFLEGAQVERIAEKLEKDAVSDNVSSLDSESEADSENGSSIFSDEPISGIDDGHSWLSSCFDDEKDTNFEVAKQNSFPSTSAAHGKSD